MITPKKDFIDSGLGTPHNELVGSGQVVQSITTAFAQFCLSINAGGPMEKSDAFAQIQGARKFIETWMNLGKKHEPIQEDPRQLKPLR